MPESTPEIGQAGGTNPKGLLAFLRQHSGIALASFAALAAAWYLFMRPSSSSATPKAVSIPGLGGGASGGGGSSGGGGGGPVGGNGPPGATVPFNPDYGLLAGIADAGYKALVEQLYNLEVQINQATVAGDTAKVNQLTTLLNGVQQKITDYVMPGAGGSTPASGNITATAITAFQRAFSDRFQNFGQAVYDAATNTFSISTPGPLATRRSIGTLSDVYGFWATGIRSAFTSSGYDTSNLKNADLVSLWNQFQSGANSYDNPTAAAQAMQSWYAAWKAGLIGTAGQIYVSDSSGVQKLPAQFGLSTAGQSRGAQASVNRNLVRGR